MKPKVQVQEYGGHVRVSTTETNVDPKVLYKLGMTQLTQRRFAELAPGAFGFIPDLAKKEDFIRIGEALWKESYAHGGDREAGEGLIAWAERQPPRFLEFFEHTQNHLVWYALARWADQAFPTVTMGERFCAALLATQIPTEMVEEVEAPWHAFVIEVPGRMLSVFDGDLMQRTRIARILVHKTEHPSEPWRWIAFGERGQHVWRSGFANQLLKPVKFDKKSPDAQFNYMGEDGERAFDDDLHRDERLYVVISRLVFNVCLAVADPDQVKQVGSSHRRHTVNQKEGRRGPPEQRVFQVGKPINLDCRDAIQEYVEGERTARELKVQSLTRGYWRQQPHGPKLSLRRKQWIMPYWRGPEGAPILTRPHVFPEDSG